MSVHILEIRFVALRGSGAVGYGVDEDGREFAVALDASLATDIATAIDCGRRPIVAVEPPLYPAAIPERALIAHIVARLDARGVGDGAHMDGMPR
jgi:hypothetical protein